MSPARSRWTPTDAGTWVVDLDADGAATRPPDAARSSRARGCAARPATWS